VALRTASGHQALSIRRREINTSTSTGKVIGRARASRHEPGAFYVNRYVKLIESDLFGLNLSVTRRIVGGASARSDPEPEDSVRKRNECAGS
jgi:hypothetical protein